MYITIKDNDWKTALCERDCYEGNHDSCIAIRTAIISKNILHLQAGAGIVSDSIPENEYQETFNKAKGMLKALALAEQISS